MVRYISGIFLTCVSISPARMTMKVPKRVRFSQCSICKCLPLPGSCGGQPYGSPPPDSGNTIIIATGGKQHHDMQHVAVAANETVGTTAEGPQTIMIIQEEDLEDLNDSVAQSDGQVCLEAHITNAGPTASHMTNVEMTTATCKVCGNA